MDETTVGSTAVAETPTGDTGGASETLGEVGGEQPAGEGAAAGAEGTGEGGEEAGADGELSDEAALEGIETDGRRVDARNRTAFAKLAKVDQAAAKQIRDLYFRTQALVKETGAENAHQAINLVRQMRATIDSLGGDEGITEMQSEISDYRNEIRQFAEGDPALLGQLYEASPEGVVTSTRNALDLLAGKDMKLFDQAVMGSMVARLDKAGMYSSMDALLGFIKEGKGQEAYDLANQIVKWLNDAKALSDKQVKLRNERNPEREQLEREREEFNSEKATHYDKEVSVDVNRLNNRATAKVVNTFFNEIGLPTEGRREFVNALNSRIYKAMKADRAWQRAAHAIKDKGDASRTAEFIAQKFEEMLPDHFRKLRNEMYPNYKAKKPAGKPNGAAAAGAAKVPGATVTSAVNTKPGRDEVDWTKTSQTMFIAGRAFLKNGKERTWDWKKVAS